jgi:carboxymethylenebutenolidase
MCDELQLAGMGHPRVNRRDFARIGVLGGLVAACAPGGEAQAQAGIKETQALFTAPGGKKMDAYFVYPGQGKHPAVIMWPDIAGARDSFRAMAKRLARAGYSVLLLNPYYQDAEAPQFDDFDAFRSQDGMNKVAPWREKLTPTVVMDIAKAAVGFLDKQDSVDTAKGIGVQGYCMTGGFAVWSAAAVPERIKAVASFHGAGLVGDTDTAPVKELGQTQAAYLFAIARNDDKTAPTDKDALKAAAAAAGRPATVEVFRADHGWTVDDSPVFDVDLADKAWTELLDLYKKNL